MIAFPNKIAIPQRPATLVSRPRLLEALAPIRTRRLITLVAPAGYGKTSLLIDFVTAHAPYPVCWYTLDRFDGDPWVFVEYLTAALAQQSPNALPNTTALLSGPGRVSLNDTVATLTREVAALDQPLIVVIDDWHLVDSIPEIVTIIDLLLTRCPNCHLILASRSYPSIPDLMLLIARKQMIGLDEQPLRFTPTEICTVLAAEHQSDVSLAEATRLAEQTHGWITGVLLSYQPDGSLATNTTASTDPQVYHFLVEQVFNRQSADIQSFLLDTALLDEISADQCLTFLARTDGHAAITYLLKHHLFVHEVKPGVMRYHPLFREFLLEHYRCVDVDRYHKQVSRVAAVYAGQRQWNQAFELNLSIGATAAVQRIMAIGGEELYAHGRLETLERWFQIMPLECLDTPLLCLKAKILVDRGHAPEAQILVDLARARMHPDQEPAVLLLQAKLERITGNYETALATARRAYEQSRDPSQQATALCLIANCQFRLGSDIGDAIEHLHRALEIERQRGDLYALAMIQHDLGMCYEAMGMLSEAETCYVNGSAAWSTLGNQGRQAMVLNSTGVVQHMRGRYHEAHATLRTALQKAQDSGVPAYVAAILTSLGDLYSDLELWEQAHTAYHDAQQQGGSAFIRSYLELAVIRLSLRQHQPRAAALALKQISPTTQQRQNAQIMLLHGMLACLQRDYAQAIAIARQVIAEAAPDTLREIAQAHLCYAWGIAGATPTETTELLAALERAAQIGTQLGNDTFLIVETLPMRAVLRQAAAAGWPHATEWLTRQQDLRLLAQFLTRTDERPVFVVRTLGADQITLNGQPIDIGWQKAREVLYYLLAHPNGSAADTLREEIWPDLPPQRSRDALKTAIYKLRAVLPQGLIVSQGRQIYRLDLETVYLDYDVMQFLATLETYRDNDEALFDALDLYRGAYLPWSDNPWSSAIRTALEQRYLQILRLMATRRFSHRAYLDALALYQRLLAVDNLDEAAHSGVMRCFIALGYRAAAIEQYRTLCRLIQDELGLDIDRDSEAERLYHQIIAAP